MIQIQAFKLWNDFAEDTAAHESLQNALPAYIIKQRWFGGKALKLQRVRIEHILPLIYKSNRYYLLVLEVFYEDHEQEYYLLPVSWSAAQNSFSFAFFHGAENGYLADATLDVGFQKAIFELLLDGAQIKMPTGKLNFERGKAVADTERYYFSHLPALDQSNSSIFFNDKYFMKIYRKLFRETNPEVEMLRHLTESGGYAHVPSFCGSIIWERAKIPPVTIGLLMGKIDAPKDNWSTTGDELNDFLHAFIDGDFSIHEAVFEGVELLARRTAQMHAALAVATKDKSFSTEKFNPAYRNWIYDHLMNLLDVRIKMLAQKEDKLDEEAKRMAHLLMQKRAVIEAFFERIKKRPLKSLRTRIHGDFHLGQVLYHQRDFVIIDFEGEPESSILERKIKHSPLKDVAGIIRSYHYAVSAKLFYSSETTKLSNARIQRAADRWFYLIRETFTETYLEELGPNQKLYHNKSEINFLFLLHLLEKAIYEVGYELNGRPNWLKIPLRGVEQVLNELEKFEG
jgi:maltose alpha-D-glucosyltransferase/alpha-amylase